MGLGMNILETISAVGLTAKVQIETTPDTFQIIWNIGMSNIRMVVHSHETDLQVDFQTEFTPILSMIYIVSKRIKNIFLTSTVTCEAIIFMLKGCSIISQWVLPLPLWWDGVVDE